MGTIRFSPGFNVKRTAIAPARLSPLLTQCRSLLDSRPSFENGVQTSEPSVKAAKGSVEVIGENRAIPLKGGAFEDDFKPYEVHLYRIK